MTDLYKQNLELFNRIGKVYAAQSQALIAQSLQTYQVLADSQAELLQAGARIAEAQLNGWTELIGATLDVKPE